MVYQQFVPDLHLVFILFTWPFTEQMFLIFDLSTFSFLDHDFGVKSNNSLLSCLSWRIFFLKFCVFSPKVYIFTFHIISSIIYFESILYKMWGLCVSASVCYCCCLPINVHLFQCPLLKTKSKKYPILSPLNHLYIFVKNQLSIFIRVCFCVLPVVTFFCVSVTLSIPHCYVTIAI